MRRLAAILSLLVMGACAGGEPLPPPDYDDPILYADGSLTGVTGVDSRHWALVDRNLRSGVFWYSFMNQLTVQCRVTFPEQTDFLDEVNLLLDRAAGQAVRKGIAMEGERLKRLAEGADRAITALDAMSVAEVDVSGIVRRWIRKAVGEDVSDDKGWIKGCSMLFDRKNLRGLMRNSTQPLAEYYERMRTGHLDIYAATRGAEGIERRLNKI